VKKQEKRHLSPGDKFNHLMAIKIVEETEYLQDQKWLCKCDCGNFTIASRRSLFVGDKKSCGCLIGKATVTHGMTNTRIYGIYCGILSRCYNKNRKAYKDYGGRGITVCDEWLDNDGFQSFYDWSMENGYSDKLSIDRIDNNKGYNPDNCRWVDRNTQANNKRNNVIVEYKGEKYTITDLAKKVNMKRGTLYRRIITKGWSVEKAVETEVENLIEYNGETHTISEWSKITGIYKETIRYRLKNGWSIEKALTQKYKVKHIDIADIKKTIENGQFVSFVKNGVIYLKDIEIDKTVEIGKA
jgi:hypothetical protein